jgi:hypothetical protein
VSRASTQRACFPYHRQSHEGLIAKCSEGRLRHGDIDWMRFRDRTIKERVGFSSLDSPSLEPAAAAVTYRISWDLDGS